MQNILHATHMLSNRHLSCVLVHPPSMHSIHRPIHHLNPRDVCIWTWACLLSLTLCACGFSWLSCMLSCQWCSPGPIWWDEEEQMEISILMNNAKKNKESTVEFHNCYAIQHVQIIYITSYIGQKWRRSIRHLLIICICTSIINGSSCLFWCLLVLDYHIKTRRDTRWLSAKKLCAGNEHNKKMWVTEKYTTNRYGKLFFLQRNKTKI